MRCTDVEEHGERLLGHAVAGWRDLGIGWDVIIRESSGHGRQGCAVVTSRL